jgi:tetratricopeptide (TPR) repeat protein
MWAERGMNLDEAESLIRKAVEAEPESAAYLDSLAWVVFKQGRVAEALPYMLRALEHMAEPDATLYEHLGDIHFELGNRAEALEAWRKSLALEPNDLVAERYQRAGGVLDAESPAPDSP